MAHPSHQDRTASRRSLALVAALAACVAALALLAPAAFAARGGNPTPDLCRNYWPALSTDTGDAFTGVGDCIAFGVRGGSFAPYLVTRPFGTTAFAYDGGGLEPGAAVYLCDSQFGAGCVDEFDTVRSDGTVVGTFSPCDEGSYLETLDASHSVIDSAPISCGT